MKDESENMEQVPEVILNFAQYIFTNIPLLVKL